MELIKKIMKTSNVKEVTKIAFLIFLLTITLITLDFFGKTTMQFPIQKHNIALLITGFMLTSIILIILAQKEA